MALLAMRRLRRWAPCYPRNLAFSHTQKSNYVDVTMKWKKDPFFDTVDILIRVKELKALISLKNIIANEPTGCIPVSTVSKLDRILEISGRVASFLRKYPAVFEEFTGPQYNHPWFKLTQDAADLDRKERELYAVHRLGIVDRLRRLILMSREKRLPLRIVQGMLWYLGLPEDYLKSSEEIQNGYFQIVRMQDGEQGLSASIGPNEEVISVLQLNAMKLNGNIGSPPSVIKFPLFPSKGLCLKQKIEMWLEEFQKLQYVSPYEEFSTLDPNSDISEKRVIGVLHELLCLFVDNSAERRKLLCLKKHLGLPQKFHKAFERHPHVFYLLLKNKSCFVVLKEAYCANSATVIERHPLFNVRNEYVRLMHKSENILRSRRGLKVCDETSHGKHDESLSLSNTKLCCAESEKISDLFERGIQNSKVFTFFLTTHIACAVYAAGYLTHDPCVVEGKKPGKAKARMSFQWVKWAMEKSAVAVLEAFTILGLNLMKEEPTDMPL
ncbi:hypothetical protein ZIOFF_027086 [Zingiber officinale]|uniref:PORR domain-containing protein n=1 Tax=Zingiber officinale TaxID=94328 RepID=A0A8J5LIE6_ZINOF|nr:hypothetical protein ZIOFF_027086 [Zingiber officinale]